MSFSEYIRVEQLIDLGRFAEARDLARESLEEAPDDAMMLSKLADIERHISGPERALEIVERALALDGQRATFHAQRAYFLSLIGRHEEADAGFVDALTLDPNHRFALAARVEAVLRDPRSTKRKHKSERMGAAKYCADALLTTYPNTAVSHLMDAKVKLANRDFDGCDAAAAHALRLEPDNPVGHQLVGLAAEAKGDTRKAGDAFVSAQRIDPTSSTGLEGLRRLGKSAIAPIGFATFLVLRLGLRAGRATGSIIAGIVLFAVFGAIAYFFHQQRKVAEEQRVDLSPEAQSILDQDKKFR